MKKVYLSIETWVFICLTVISLTLLFISVDLNPHVDYDVFFSSEDPNYLADIEISRLFPRNDSQIILSVIGDIYTEKYQKKMRTFSDLLLTINQVTDIKSITHGPKNFGVAMHSPFWKRLLIPSHKQSSHVLVILDEKTPLSEMTYLIPKVENIINIFESDDFQIKISGFPYIVELIRRNLTRDLRIFTSLALFVFGIAVIFIFHSGRILLGMIVASANTCAFTFMITHHFNIKIGILTANLSTITFVLTLTHIVFLTFNWKNLTPREQQENATDKAIAMTLPASFWAMVTTLMGFISLLYVPAKPLRELGISGAIATFIAFLVAYGIYPSFLRLQKPGYGEADAKIQQTYFKILHFFEMRQSLIIVLIFGIIIVTLPFHKYINTDPSLISFFNKKSEITKGLEFIDQSGGSNPLVIVVESKTGKSLNTNEAYQSLWALQKALENHDATGAIISLPVLLAEGKRAKLSIFLSTEKILRILDRPQYNQITRSFVTQDRRYGLFLLRMKESGRKIHRLHIIGELKEIIEGFGFRVHLVGGIYALQGNLSQHVAKSLVFGLARLILLFSIIALIVSRSLTTTFAMTISISIIPLCVLGLVGLFKIPLDIIAAPAVNVIIAMGIDAMIHMVHYYHRIKKYHKKASTTWIYVRKKLWEPIVTSTLIVCSGFGIFFFSSFPPTQRFGGSIVFGTLLAALSALFIFPLMAKKN